jgi:hypothetical protein
MRMMGACREPLPTIDDVTVAVAGDGGADIPGIG